MTETENKDLTAPEIACRGSIERLLISLTKESAGKELRPWIGVVEAELIQKYLIYAFVAGFEIGQGDKFFDSIISNINL
jgi:hypothetical protein